MSVGGGAGDPALASSNHYSFLRDNRPYPNSANITIQMTTLPFFISLFIFLSILPYTTSNPVCDSYLTCGNESPNIQFPFSIRDRNPGKRCGYPGFELSCHKDRALLSIPNAGNFVVTNIFSDSVLIDDTDGCFPKRFLDQNVSLEGTPFEWGEDYHLVYLTFLKCSNLTDWDPSEHVPCLGSSYNNSDVVLLFPNEHSEMEWNSSCQVISSAWIPMSYSRRWYFSDDIYSEIELKWSKPDCGMCDPYEQCGFVGETSLDVTCYLRNITSPTLRYDANKDSSAGSAFGKAIGIAVAAIICLMLMQCLACGRSHRQQPQASLELPTLIAPEPPFFAVTAVGLDRSIIETYPKIEVSESGALPDPNDNVCSICLCEYQPKETLRSIPYCNHYFHLNCLDEWLKMNATCPLCRNLLPGSSLSMLSTSS
ncbi:hypothetical protein L6164_037090 [Bauhinia variegata]|uniref:Uncharacterized protein n=1 Tax=Bauhinia variegata TaxID=167791 RepID=A0ACB9KJ62_BAUVA|nr:hypothetical protein L6164_037090 [Bauhinia variegata]